MKQNFAYKKRIKKYQQEKNLTDPELELFHQSMEELKQHIHRYEDATKKSKQLLKIEKVYGGLKSSKEIFQELLKYPHELTKFSNFLYQAIPGAADASEKVVMVQYVNLSSIEIEKSIEKILSTMIVISSNITNDYEQIIREDSEEIELTRKILEKNSVENEKI